MSNDAEALYTAMFTHAFSFYAQDRSIIIYGAVIGGLIQLVSGLIQKSKI